MFRMVEIIGTSEVGFSEAVKDAINRILDSGEKAHFFEIVEQRGAVREGKFKEFQVKIKVAIESEEKKRAGDEEVRQVCPTCLQPTGEEGHLCLPVAAEDKRCDWCGALIPDERHLCNEKIRELSYICNSCGRTAVKAEYLCQPKKIES